MSSLEVGPEDNSATQVSHDDYSQDDYDVNDDDYDDNNDDDDDDDDDICHFKWKKLSSPSTKPSVQIYKNYL